MNLDPRTLLDSARIYKLFQAILGAASAQRVFVQTYIDVTADESILDIGCGPATILDSLPSVRYVGFDPDQNYVEAARQTYGGRGEFHLGGVSNPPDLKGGFDWVLALGVIHHLPDNEAEALMDLARSQLRESGAFVSIDPVITENQHPIARFLVRRDRGGFVRSEGEYRSLAAKVFPDFAITVHHDLLRVPYSHAVLTAVAAPAPDA